LVKKNQLFYVEIKESTDFNFNEVIQGQVAIREQKERFPGFVSVGR